MTPAGMTAAREITSRLPEKQAIGRRIGPGELRKNPRVPINPKEWPKRWIDHWLTGVPGSRPSAREQGEAADPKTEHAEHVDEQVHGDDLRGVLGAAQARGDQSKPGLHQARRELPPIPPL
jgi:hypothetical protein